MSEFTDGVIFRQSDLPHIEQAASRLNQPYFIRTLNERWGVLFPEQREMQTGGGLRLWLTTTSRVAPLFYFQNAEDHGWAYHVFKDKQEIANLNVSYEMAYLMAHDLAERRYSEVEDIQQLPYQTWQELYAEVYDSAEYLAALRKGYSNCNFAAFGVFDIAPEVIAQLEAAITPEAFLESAKAETLNGLQQVEFFKSQLELNELSWQSYDYLARD